MKNFVLVAIGLATDSLLYLGLLNVYLLKQIHNKNPTHNNIKTFSDKSIA